MKSIMKEILLDKLKNLSTCKDSNILFNCIMELGNEIEKMKKDINVALANIDELKQDNSQFFKNKAKSFSQQQIQENE